jgi:hypothetical protein
MDNDCNLLLHHQAAPQPYVPDALNRHPPPAPTSTRQLITSTLSQSGRNTSPRFWPAHYGK